MNEKGSNTFMLNQREDFTYRPLKDTDSKMVPIPDIAGVPEM
ncbi:hypothetical protein [Desulfosporosinus hippei]|uniref:Uncharacterized protein n=1 Tax=Desulfosporosinus hippei DSM 8344 TaxID=1121419 RepID=A0A1G8FQJ1_9FIRM|nr:hypothetical protein [Desulfosporosinus hippei]SDH84347.1 hypothetical protein SAMN05443529_12043 [Desulfosporosinus hippei DSM 8344]